MIILRWHEFITAHYFKTGNFDEIHFAAASYWGWEDADVTMIYHL
jgi:hypothetical protein